MAVAPPVKINARRRPAALRGEVWIRYAAATFSTLTAIAAESSAPGMQSWFIWSLVGVTLLGLPVSLALRFSRLRIGNREIPRLLVSASWSSLATLAILLFVINPLQQRIHTTLLSPDFVSAFFNRHDADEAIAIILQVFSIIMVCRCFVIISDKDTVLSTVPAFCVLVLLIVVERRPGVVAFFVLWAATAAILFSLDHRQEITRRASAVVPAFLPGQSALLSARTLIGLMVFSVLCAAILSYTVTSRIEDRSAAEGWISELASKLTQFATTLPDVSVNAGPERQIDFTSGPSLPTRSPLWRISAQDMATGASLSPNYWRMFTLTHYSGTGWTQAESRAVRVPLNNLGDVGLIGLLPRPIHSGGVRRQTQGYAIARQLGSEESGAQSFGAPRRRVRQRLTALRQNLGFIPHLPSPLFLDIPGPRVGARPDYISAFADQSVDMRFLEANQSIIVISDVPPTDDYGIGTAQPPLLRSEKPHPTAHLSREERQLFLQLPPALERVHDLAIQASAELPADASDYARALQLANAVENSASYTLRPPALPDGRDATEFFLFESRRGYCTYFAGALAVMCRSVGIPARVVSGFTAGTRRFNGDFEVLEANAHAWTEVWVPNWGWATLDATPAADRGDNAGDWWTSLSASLSQVFDMASSWMATNRLRVALLLLAIAVTVLSVMRENALLPVRRLTSLRFKRHITDTAARATVDEVYERMAHALEKRFRARPSWETPHEWLDAAQATLQLHNPQPLRRLTDLFIQARYSPRPLGAEEIEEAWRALSQICWDKERSV